MIKHVDVVLAGENIHSGDHTLSPPISEEQLVAALSQQYTVESCLVEDDVASVVVC